MRQSSGQALLVTLLVLSVVLTAGLSLVSRTVTDIAISEEETQSQEAFEAAEAGIEEALNQIQSGEEIITLDSGALNIDQVDVSVSDFSADNTQEISPGQMASIWLNYFDLAGEDFPNSAISYDSGTVQLCWGDITGSVEAVVYYLESGDYKAQRYHLTSSAPCADLDNGTSITLPAASVTDNKFISLRYYGGSDSTVAIAAEGEGDSLPEQGKIVESQATQGDVTRKIKVTQSWPRPPEFFDFAIFSEAGLNK